jgi:hypothetical protein
MDKSIATLVKFNNGAFKSEAQAQLFLRKAQDGVYYSAGGSVHGNSFRNAYHINQEGVYKVEKLTRNKTTTVWTKDTTDAWKAVNTNRDARKELAAWINKARSLYNTYEQGIVPLVMKGTKSQFVVARATRLQNLKTMIDAAQERYDNMLRK